MFETLKLDTDARGVATLTLARADKHNALSGQMIEELTEAARELAAGDARVVVLAAEGETFCAGGDLGWMQAQFQASAEERHAEASKLAHMLQALNTLPQPLIGRIHGHAFGGGLGMASVCDVAIGVPGIKMAFTETRLGLIPATIGPYVAARMGEANARRVFMSGRIMEAKEAQQLGILARVVTPKQLDAAIKQEVTPYLATAPEAVARAKRLLRSLGPKIDEETIRHSIDELVACWEGQEAKEGIAAFFEQRKPNWVSK